jgi:hypothetical protein
MKNVILVIFDAADVAALPLILAELAPPERLWIVHNPSIGIDVATAAREADGVVANLKALQKAAIAKQDFAAAIALRDQIQDATVNRDTAIKVAYERIPQPELQALHDKAISPVVAWSNQHRINAMATCLKDEHEKNQVGALLQYLLPQWPPEIPHGEYALIFPTSGTGKAVSAQVVVPMRTLTSPPVSAPPKPVVPEFAPDVMRRHQLKKNFALVAARKKYGIAAAIPKQEAIDWIIKTEFPEAVPT